MTDPEDEMLTPITIPKGGVRDGQHRVEAMAAERRRYMIWSNEKRRWWRARRRGYTHIIEWAGVYDEAEALEIVARSARGRQTLARDEVTQYPDQWVPNDVLVPVVPDRTGAPT